MAEKKKNPLKVVTPKARLSFPELFKAKKYEKEDGSESDETFSAQFLFEKNVDLSTLKKACVLAAKTKWGDDPPKGLKLPFRDGNEKELDGYQDTTVVSASTKYKPDVIKAKFDHENKPVKITSEEEIYPGCYVRAALVAYAWEYTHPKTKKVMKRGVSFRLESVQKMGDGPSFINRPDVADTFDSQDDGSEDADNFELDGGDDDLDFLN